MDPADVERDGAGAALAPTRRSHVRRYIYGGLAAAGAVAVGLVVIFMLGQSGAGADRRGSFQNAGSESPLPAAQITVMSEGASDAPVVFHQEQSNGFTITTTVKIEGLGGNTTPTVVNAAAAEDNAVPIAHITTTATVEEAAGATAAATPETDATITAVHNDAVHPMVTAPIDDGITTAAVDSVASATTEAPMNDSMDVVTAEETAAAADLTIGTFSQVSTCDVNKMYRDIQTQRFN